MSDASRGTCAPVHRSLGGACSPQKRGLGALLDPSSPGLLLLLGPRTPLVRPPGRSAHSLLDASVPGGKEFERHETTAAWTVRFRLRTVSRETFGLSMVSEHGSVIAIALLL